MNDCVRRQEAGFQVVAVRGEVDLSWSSDVRTAVLGALEEGDTLVELSAVTYIDSSGIAALVEGYQTAKTSNRKFALLASSESVLKVLELARLDQVFPMFGSLQAAAEAG